MRLEAQGGQPFAVASVLNRLSFLPFIRLVGRGGGTADGVYITTDRNKSQKKQDLISPDL